MNSKSLLLIVTLGIAFLVVQPFIMSATEYHSTFDPLSAWASWAPTIDGRITPGETIKQPGFFPPVIYLSGEWDRADNVNFTLTYRGEVHNATLYVMNDYVNLYLAFRIQLEDYNVGDTLKLEFDNNHNGVRDLGENVLRLYGDSYFKDQYVYDASTGSSQNDVVDGGIHDGVGAVQHFWKAGYYDFEIAFPLLTADSAHDFSLSPGLLPTVGFLLSFFDYDGPGDVAGDTWPSPFYDEMLDITIAACPTLPSGVYADLSITGIEATQAIQLEDNSMPLVEGKATAVRVYVDIGALATVDVTVYLYGLDGWFRTSLGALAVDFSAPDVPVRSSTHNSANFLLPMDWIERDRLILKAFVRTASDDQWETSYSNNWLAEQTLEFGTTVIPTIYVVPINIGSAANPDVPWDQTISTRENYFRRIFPVADVNFIRLPWETIGPNAPGVGNQLINMLTQQGYALGLVDYGVNQIFGVTQSGGGLSDPAWTFFPGHGIAACGDGSIPLSIMAHEINHNWGPGTWGRHAPGCSEPGPDPSWPYPDGSIQEPGFNLGSMDVVWPGTPDVMTYCMASFPPLQWISPYRWQHIYNRLGGSSAAASTGTIQQVGESLMISGWVSQNGTGSLDPIFYLPGERESSSVPGNYSLILKNNVGETIMTYSFQAQYVNAEEEEQDPYYFTVLLPREPSIANIQLMYRSTRVLDEITMSKNIPVVTIRSPNGGEEWDSTVQTISWQATDSDGDPLTYRLYYSPDSGSTWTPISPPLTERSYQINASHIQGTTTALVRVVASDGFNTGLDESDALFTVAGKPPTAEILQPQNGSHFHLNDVILLSGRGTDADDIILKEAAYNWTSSLDGYLGNGSTLTATLTPGTHQVTLTVSDSNGNTANDTITLKVNLDIEIISVTPSKTVVGQNSFMSINATFENRGSVTWTFNVSSAASNESSKTAAISTTLTGFSGFTGDILTVTLSPGNSTTMGFIWETTDTPKGNYTISITASLPEYEVTRFTDTIVVALLGDITGSEGSPDGKVDMRDVGLIARHFGESVPPVNPNFNIYEDWKIDMRDIGIAARQFGST